MRSTTRRTWWTRVLGAVLPTALVAGLLPLVTVAPAQAAQTVAWGSLTPVAANGSLPALALSADGAKATAVWLDRANSRIESASATISGNTATWSAV